MSWVAAGFATAAAVTGVVTMIDSNNKANDAFERQKEIDADMRALEQARQEIPDPSRHIKDLSRKITNPFANLAVATGAAKIQAEETDLSLAATLDVLKATGSAAGGATALAQAALRSKKGISASIEKQEVGNQQLRAKGELAMQQAKVAEQRRVQSARAAGEQWMFGKRETRELQGLNRMAALQQQNQAQQMQYRVESAQAAGMTSQAIMGGVTAGIGAGQKSGTVDPKSGTVDQGDITKVAMDQPPELYMDTGGTPTSPYTAGTTPSTFDTKTYLQQGIQPGSGIVSDPTDPMAGFYQPTSIPEVGFGQGFGPQQPSMLQAVDADGNPIWE